MALNKMGLNLTNLNNITAPNIDINTTAEGIVKEVPERANEITKGWLGGVILLGLFFWLFWKINRDLYNGGDFGFSVQRSIGVASCICSIIGLYCLNIGYFVNFYHVAIFIIVSFMTAGIVWKMQR